MHSVWILLKSSRMAYYDDRFQRNLCFRWQSQRLAIARAFLKNAPILILDEATAFADPDNERLVQQAFEKLSKGKTVIMIAHRLSTVTAADQIYVLADGKVAEHGTHEELLAKDAVYGHMWKEYNRSVNWQVGKGGVTA